MTSLFTEALAFASAYWVVPFILMLGSFSVTRLIVADSFPPIEKLRNWVYDRFPHDGYVTTKRPRRGEWVIISNAHYRVNIGHWFGELISCYWCAGWWVSLAVSACFVAWPLYTSVVLLPFALRGLVGIIGYKTS